MSHYNLFLSTSCMMFDHRRRQFHAIVVTTLSALGVLLAISSVTADGGASVYASRCASCHGEVGQGAEDAYDKPLVGELSVQALAELIERTMPEGEPEECTGEEAIAVARYIHREFYSRAARIAKGLIDAPKIELARLTVPQHRNALADLIGQFTPQRTSNVEQVEPGLTASYYQSKGMTKAHEIKLKQVDHRIDFDFGQGSPHADMEADQFAAIWEGALSADETGYFEFRITTQNGARLYLNNDQTGSRKRLRDDSSAAGQSALIDAWVSSGEHRTTSARVFLITGRQYPIRLEYFKYKEQTASVKLEWKPPHGTWAVLDQRHCSTAIVPRTFVCTTPFPADDRSLGYERGVSVSREWHAAATTAASEAVAEIMERLPLLIPNLEAEPQQRLAQLKSFVLRFARVAFRRPLTERETILLEHDVFRIEDADEATKRALLFVLTSPHFLYLDLSPMWETGEHGDSSSERHVLNQYATASRLSFLLWDSIPNGSLFDAAADNRLDEATLEKTAREMLEDPRAKAKIREFFRQWLEFDERDRVKDAQLFPEFDEQIITDLRYSLECFVEHVVWSAASDYRQLLLSSELFLNDRLRQIYGEPPADEVGELADEPPQQDVFRNVSFPGNERSGVLTHPYLLSALAYHNNTSPIHRGVFLTRNVVGRSLKPPPVAVAFKDNEFDPNLTMREKITQLTSETSCISCHSVINPLGFALENYDAIGRWRAKDNGQPIDSKSEYVTELGDTKEFQSAREIAEFAADNYFAHQAFVTQLFLHLVKQNPDALGLDTIEQLCENFAEDEFNVRNLIVRIAVLAASTHASGSLAEEK